MSGILKTAWLGKTFLCFDELDSTNMYLKQHAAELPHGSAVIAKRQTAGRGRLGRSWQDGKDSLALSVLLHRQDVGRLSLLPLVAGVAVASALEALTGEAFKLKWSNDVLYEDKKISGILGESRISKDGAFAVIGMGANLKQSRRDLDGLGLVYATSLQLATGKIFEVLPVAYEICGKLEPLLEELQENGFASIRESYKKYCATLGQKVRVITGDAEQTGTAVDIAEDGGLVFETGGELVTVRAGEASVRGLYGYA